MLRHTKRSKSLIKVFLQHAVMYCVTSGDVVSLVAYYGLIKS